MSPRHAAMTVHRPNNLNSFHPPCHHCFYLAINPLTPPCTDNCMGVHAASKATIQKRGEERAKFESGEGKNLRAVTTKISCARGKVWSKNYWRRGQDFLSGKQQNLRPSQLISPHLSPRAARLCCAKTASRGGLFASGRQSFGFDCMAESSL